MQDFAARLTGYRQVVPGSSTVVGHGTGWLPVNRARLRLGMWPIQSKSEPEIAMGLAAILGFLMERWQSVRVYRLFAIPKGQPHEYEWMISQSQFGVDDWELDDLDENVAIWGSLEQYPTKYLLKLEVENDLAADEDSVHIEQCECANLADLLARLPGIAESIANYLDAGDPSPIVPTYNPAQWDASAIEQVLKLTFHWELNLFLALWGKRWSDLQVLEDYRNLFRASASLDNDLGDWIASNAVARVLSPIYSPFGDSFLENLEKIDFGLEPGWMYSLTIALAHYRSGEAARAYDLLEASVTNYPDKAISWLALANMYWQTGEVGLAVDTFQRAIESGATSVAVYTRYAELLSALDANNVIVNVGEQRRLLDGRTFVEHFTLIKPENVPHRQLLREAIRSYQAALELEPDNAGIICQLLIQLIDLQDASIWTQFDRLVGLDLEGNYVRIVLETMYSVDDMTLGVRILATAANRYPDRVDIHLNLAFAYLLDEQGDAARVELEKVRNMSEEPKTNAEIDRLMLSANAPDFEIHFGELTDMVNAGNEISVEDVEFLEDVVAEASLFADGYILLANAYLNRDEISDALDTLLDGQQLLTDNADLATLLARVLWQLGETQMAFDSLNKSFLKNPNHVPSLALMGRFLFEDGQENEAKIFLARAESLDPGDSALNDVRIFIANAKSR